MFGNVICSEAVAFVARISLIWLYHDLIMVVYGHLYDMVHNRDPAVESLLA